MLANVRDWVMSTRLLLGGVVIAYLLTSVVSHPYMGGFPSRSYLEYAINLNERCEAEAAEHDGRGTATLFAHSVPVHPRADATRSLTVCS